MTSVRALLIEDIEERASRRIGQLAGELVRARSDEKEVILAQLQFEHWLADSCRECLQSRSDA